MLEEEGREIYFGIKSNIFSKKLHEKMNINEASEVLQDCAKWRSIVSTNSNKNPKM